MATSLFQSIDRTQAWTKQSKVLAEDQYSKYDVVLQIVDTSTEAPFAELINAVKGRRKKVAQELPVITLNKGTAVVQITWDDKWDTFASYEKLRRAFELALSLSSSKLALDIRVQSTTAVQNSVYTALVSMPSLSPDTSNKKDEVKLTIAGCARVALQTTAITAHANTVARRLTYLPPNELSSNDFLAVCRKFGKAYGLRTTVYSQKQLQAMGAGAILAVGRGSIDKPPAIIRLSYRPKDKKRVALVGKGVCFDTGGINLKPANYMRGMSKDMAGGATVLASIAAIAQSKIALGVDAWIAIVENDVGPNAYRPDEVVTALNGKRIEIIHTDAEGRMILADTLTLTSRDKPDTIISYATLTGTMHVALAERMSGFFASCEKQHSSSFVAAKNSGERLCYFPMPDDYKDSLESKVADIKQCAEKGEADHIRAALFLREFIENDPNWIHMDLSAVSCDGGLGALSGPLTGFGVAWTLDFLNVHFLRQ